MPGSEGDTAPDDPAGAGTPESPEASPRARPDQTNDYQLARALDLLRGLALVRERAIN